ncbi:hypothetical protein D3C83_131180 [compost metagenome]
MLNGSCHGSMKLTRRCSRYGDSSARLASAAAAASIQAQKRLSGMPPMNSMPSAVANSTAAAP